MSTADNRHGRHPLVEHGVNDSLDALGGADAHLVIDRHTDESKRLLSASQTDDTPDGLGDTDVVHIPHEQDCLQSADVDALGQDGVVQNHELLGRILTPSVQSVEEGFPVNFLPVDDSTSCLLYTSPSPRDRQKSRMPSSA